MTYNCLELSCETKTNVLNRKTCVWLTHTRVCTLITFASMSLIKVPGCLGVNNQ